MVISDGEQVFVDKNDLQTGPIVCFKNEKKTWLSFIWPLSGSLSREISKLDWERFLKAFSHINVDLGMGLGMKISHLRILANLLVINLC